MHIICFLFTEPFFAANLQKDLHEIGTQTSGDSTQHGSNPRGSNLKQIQQIPSEIQLPDVLLAHLRLSCQIPPTPIKRKAVTSVDLLLCRISVNLNELHVQAAALVSHSTG